MTSSNGKHELLDPPENPGELGSLGSYRVISELGRGGMGFVFRAEDKRLKRTVALKVMNKKVAATPHSRSRFISEARAMAAVHHDNVATIFEVGEYSGTPFMAMEMLKGKTLEEYKLNKERPSYEQIIRFAKETAQGLAAAHAQGIVHRDIKPANIWVEQDSERIKILDFGLALAQTPVDQLAGRGSVVGTPGYLSPEQARTEPLDDRSDLYSLGVVLYELATGKLPLRSSTVAGQLIAILAHKPQPIREVNESIPQPLADLIHKLLRKEPRNRIRSAKQLVEELKRVEVECESKSEVALAINKLQMGLKEVVSKKDNGHATLDGPAAVLAAAPAADPFAALPDAPATALPADPLAVTLPGSNVGMGSSPSLARPQAAKGVKKKAAPSSPLVKYWPIAAGIATVVLIVPVLIYAFSGSGPQANQVIAPNNVVNVEPEKPQNQQPPKPTPNAQKPKPDKSQSQKDKPKAEPAQQQKTDNQQRPTTPKPATNTLAANTKQVQPRPNVPPQGSSTPQPKPQPQPQPRPQAQSSPEMVAVSTQQNRGPIPVDTDPPDPAPETSPPSQVITISSSEGNGADSTVKRGGSMRDTLGMKPSLAIQTRGKKEIQHAYIRFDLASLSPETPPAGGRGNRPDGGRQKSKERQIGKVELILHSVDADAAGATIRVYGANNPNSERWLEEGPFALSWTKSFSDAGLESLPLLADVPKVNLQGDVVKISSAELADFVRSTPLSTVTLILAGGKGNLPIQFVSRDGEVSKAPALSVEIPGP